MPHIDVSPQTRISELNAGQLRLLVNYCETKVPSLANKTILDAYTKLLRKAIVETDKRHEEEVILTNARDMAVSAQCFAYHVVVVSCANVVTE